MKANHRYYLIMALFALEVGATAFHARALLSLPGWFWPLASLASFRLARTISFNAIGIPLRQKWTKVTPDGSGAGDSVDPVPGSVLGELLACPICTGTHAALVILALTAWVQPLGLAVVAGLGLAGAAEIVHWAAELAEWNAHTSREVCGSYVRARQSAPSPIPEITERERV